MSLKDMISSPLEAGPSILDAHYLPPHVLPALEWTSSRLARKSLHITLVVARRDYQLPSVHPQVSPGLSSAPPTPATPGRRFDLSSGPVSALKQLVRSASFTGPLPMRSMEFSRTGMASPAFSQRSFDLSSPRVWPRTPVTPRTPATPLSPPPMTASTTTTDQMSSLMSSGTFGMRLIHTNGLPEKAEKALRSVLEKAEKKFRLGPEWLSPALGPAECGLTNQLVHTSIIQNEVLFSSEGLTLMSLDRLYSLKASLSSYSKTKSHLRLEDAVDDLRRIILANNGAKVIKSDILRSYDWLNVSSNALSDLDRMYRRAYGGPEKLGAIAGMSSFSERVVKNMYDIEVDDVYTEFDSDDDDEDDEKIDTEMIGIALTTTIHNILPTTPSPKPRLQIRTDLSSTPTTPVLKIPQPVRPEAERQVVEEDDDDRTARPTDRFVFTFHPAHTDNDKRGTIDQVLMTPSCETPSFLSPGGVSRVGPMTPNGYDDISPTTRGEWGFLTADDAFQGARKVTVETF